MQLTRNFTLAEIWANSETPNSNQIRTCQIIAQTILQPLRDFVGAPIRITSGKRSTVPQGGAENSEHFFNGNDGAVDINIAPIDVATNFRAFDWLMKNCRHGVGQAIWYCETTHLHISPAGRNQSEFLVCVSKANHRYNAIKTAADLKTYDPRLAKAQA